MKLAYVVFTIAGFVLILTFQNCAPSKYEAGSSETSPSTSQRMTYSDLIRQRILDGRAFICPMVMCAAPPEGCGYSAQTNAKDANGCNVDCGDLVCEQNNYPVESADSALIDAQVCPQIRCAAAPKGCAYLQRTKSANGCPTCGDLVCNKETDLPIDLPQLIPEEILLRNRTGKVCPIIGYVCPLPTANCRYDTLLRSTDMNDCQVGCRRLICD